ncbi:MAG: pyridoxal phosphate-dependent aminotransferase family protein [Mariniblastus sp.]|jgi:7-keto-8-aminopelargonate synthetase-like enzyme|nr:pyridoxal phosphate-dependent aminotransferase family protein [bacterium]MDB2526635.1 pyridoxal phosphate-dependent aminotransferase family protein [Mariniblastus sp.]MDG1510663.1 pyridoxal phosphate-dependent aminotransferase family protein [Mariniblastus sp.]MDG2183398.1 pyridoxal phosphate-dependent aminotransferase family protein [Mariniblastus sp.]
MPDIFDKCDEFWNRIKKVTGDHFDPDVFFRQFPVTNCLPNVEIEGTEYLQIATNDYLGLATHPEVVKAGTDICSVSGVGTPLGARPLTGNTAMHLQLEADLAKFRGTEASLVFNLGLGAMSGTVACMVGRKERVFVDAYAHGCLHDGARLCKGEASWFGHNDMDDLESQLAACPLEQPKLIAVDGVYGMTGDLAPLPHLVELKNKYNAQLFVDDAHGTGVLGDNGRGTPEHFGVEDQVDLHGGTFAKSFGTFGGYICGNKRALDFIKFVSPGFMLTKALPGCMTNATIKSLELMQSMPERRHQLWENITVLREGLRNAGFNIGNPKGAVTSIFTRGAMALTAVRMLMDDYKIVVNPVMYPAVPYGTSIIRMTASALHTPEEMRRLVEAIVDVSTRIPLLEGNEAAASKVATVMPGAGITSAGSNGSAH